MTLITVGGDDRTSILGPQAILRPSCRTLYGNCPFTLVICRAGGLKAVRMEFSGCTVVNAGELGEGERRLGWSDCSKP